MSFNLITGSKLGFFHFSVRKKQIRPLIIWIFRTKSESFSQNTFILSCIFPFLHETFIQLSSIYFLQKKINRKTIEKLIPSYSACVFQPNYRLKIRVLSFFCEKKSQENLWVPFNSCKQCKEDADLVKGSRRCWHLKLADKTMSSMILWKLSEIICFMAILKQKIYANFV